MRRSSVVLSAVVLLAATPALAGSLTFDNGQTTWHSTQCSAPTPPPSVYGANAETSGEDMNALISQHNAFVGLAQNYMDCVSQESEHDQAAVNQAIAASAQAEMAKIQSQIEVDASSIQKKR